MGLPLMLGVHDVSHESFTMYHIRKSFINAAFCFQNLVYFLIRKKIIETMI